MNRTLIFTVIASVVITSILTLYLSRGFNASGGKSAGEREPLYWVAPMDPDYRRDGPGKSPMGMDLVPVYEEDGDTTGDSPGTVRISPDVVNNLGVRSAPVDRRPLHSEITTVGYVNYDEDRLVHIHPRVEGWVEKLFITAAGDPVEKGQPVYSLYSPQLVSAQEELVLALNRDSARLAAAAEARLRALQIAPDVIEQIRRERQVQQTLTFFAPQTGVVDNLNIREGFYVKPGTTLMSVGNLEQVWVEAEVFERQAALVEVGLPVTMTLDYLPGRTWRGEVDYVYPTLDPETRTVRVRLRFDNPERLLKPNMFAQVAIHARSDKEALVVPREALIRTGDQERVVLDRGEGRYKSVAVTSGRQSDRYVEITEGLKAGDRVVTSAQFLIDSESSKTSDFRRLHHGPVASDNVWVKGEIEMLDREQREIRIRHEAIESWGRPAMTMDFAVAESVVIETLQPGDSVRFTFDVQQDEFVVTALQHDNDATMQEMDHD